MLPVFPNNSLGFARGGKYEVKPGGPLIVLDMVMPDLGGGAVYDGLKEINPEVRVLLSSGYGLRGQAQEILDRGCQDFIQKPFNLIQLSQKIRRILDQDLEG